MSASIEQKMRDDWNEKARSDAHYYVAFGRRRQSKAEFLSTADLLLPALQSTFCRIRTGSPEGARRALEIGCGPGRLMLPMSAFFGEVHGVDVSDEMVRLARENLQSCPGAHVHLNSGSDLSLFEDAHFDFVYSALVFQHIPSVEVITRYLEESLRVLKPGGALCCQTRGVAAPFSGPGEENDTWNGCVYGPDQAFDLSRKCGMHLLQLTGAGTQYMWIVGRKPLVENSRGATFGHPEVRAITPTDNPLQLISPSGPGAAFISWLEGFPEFTSLEALSVTLNDSEALPCYISDHVGRGAFQLNTLVPSGTPVGEYTVRVYYQGVLAAGERVIQICDYPEMEPRVVAIADGVDLAAKCATTSGSLKVCLTGIADPSTVSFSVESRRLETVSYWLYNPYVFGYEFTLSLPPQLRAGAYPLDISTPTWSYTAEIKADCKASESLP